MGRPGFKVDEAEMAVADFAIVDFYGHGLPLFSGKICAPCVIRG